jgi:hypothetical protein
MLSYIYIRGDKESSILKRPDAIHPAIQLSLMLDLPGTRIRAWFASNFTAEKWIFLCRGTGKTGFEWSGYQIGVASMRSNQYRCHCY